MVFVVVHSFSLKSNIASKFLLLYQEFNAGLFDYLIATDESQSDGKEQVDDQNGSERKKSKKHRKHKLDAEFGVVRGIDFKNVYTVSLLCSFSNLVLYLAAVVLFLLSFPLEPFSERGYTSSRSSALI